MCEVVNVEQIAFERADKLFGRTGCQADAVIDAGVVDEPVEVTEILQSEVHSGFAGLRAGELSQNKFALRGRLAEFVFQLLGSGCVLIRDDGNGAFAGTFADNGRTDAFGAAGDENDFALELKVHDAERMIVEQIRRNAWSQKLTGA